MESFVTGATGFIGRHLIPHLLARGERVHVLVRQSSLPRLEALRERWGDGAERVHAVVGDLAEPRLGDLVLGGGIGAHVKVSLAVDAIVTQRQVHILVLEAFVGLRPQGTETRHLNGIPDDNRLVNLRWGTPTENRADTLLHGTLRRGTGKPNAKLTDASVKDIRAARATGAAINALARQYGVNRTTIQQLFDGRTWNHV